MSNTPTSLVYNEYIKKDPKLDYFKFVLTQKLNKSEGDLSYQEMLKYFLKEGSRRDIKRKAGNLLSQFEARSGDNEFASKYRSFWNSKSRLRSSSSASTATANTTTITTTSKILKLFNDIPKILDSSLFGDNVFDFDCASAMTLMHQRLTAEEIEPLTSKVALVGPNLSPECRSLLSRLGAAPNSAMSFRRALFAYSEFQTAVFDPAVHEDYDTVFHLCHHFLRMIESPSCPISRSQRERTAATFTSFPILNNIFMPHMHEISFKWVEVLTESCQNTKLDGLASSLVNNHPVIVVEFAGGISTHSKGKLLSDTKKIYDCCKQAIREKNLSQIHVVLYYNNVLSLEKVAKVENQFVRKCCAQIKCPKDIVQLKKFVEDMPVIFSWRNSVLSSL